MVDLLVAPRPGHQRSCHSLRVYSFQGLSYYLAHRRRHAPRRERRFHALGYLGAGNPPDRRAAMVYGLYGPGFRVRPLDAGEQNDFAAACSRLCSVCACFETGIERSECVDADRCMRLNAQPVSHRRARIARPAYSESLGQRLRDSVMRPLTLNFITGCVFTGIGVRRRSRLRLGMVALKWLSHRRYMAKVCATWGMLRIRPGLWFDPASDRSYIQSDHDAINGWAA